jgi:hypothetical protein
LRSKWLNRARALSLATAAIILVGAAPVEARRAVAQDEMSADLDGAPIKLVDVGKWYCHDFDYPVIHCFTDPSVLEDQPQVSLAAAAAGTTYLTVYEFTTYQGAFMHMSENYSMLSLIGWNDRISSYVAKNSMSGAFWTDWLYTGIRYNFCCNQQVGSLGSYNDTFSSVFHN